jgi:dolichol-phosphate mannosyltransferase
MAFVWTIVALQALLALRVLVRMVRSARGVAFTVERAAAGETICAIVPVLDEAARLGPCLDGLIASAETVREILVVDGGSRDGTQALVAQYAARDPRVRLIDASPVPPAWNGKAWGLECGLRASSAGCAWIATLDADVAPAAALVPALVAHARRRNVPALSIATKQQLGDAGEWLLHPAMLTTLVYRYGLPGNAASRIEDVQANGQCFLARRDVLIATDAIAQAKASRCEDVDTARALVRAGHRVGFYEAGDLVVVRMYANWRETWANWPRSLAPALTPAGLAEILAVQAAPLWIVLALALIGHADPALGTLFALDVALVFMRIGVLAGTVRAYRNPSWIYWLSPLADLPVVAALVTSALRRRHVWRGRLLVTGRSS